MGRMFWRGCVFKADCGVEEACGSLDTGGVEVFLEADDRVSRVTASWAVGIVV